MRPMILALAVALAATAAHAEPGGKGNANQGAAKGGGPPAAAGEKGKNAKPDRPSDPKGPARAISAKPDRLGAAGEKRNQGQAAGRKPDTGKPDTARSDKGQGKPAFAGPPAAREAQEPVLAERGIDRRGPRVIPGSGFRWASAAPARGLIDGCPPGLAKKGTGCMPPGQAKKYRWYHPDWFGRRWDGNYRYYDGYLLRLGAGDRVLSYVPLLGGALAVGQIWPSAYEPIGLPGYYQSFYGLGAPGSYGYYDDVLYRLDPETHAITSLAALLTGEDIVVGQPMPLGYDVYNVPYPYRTDYVEGPDALYRYSDGYVYRVDPETRLVLAAIELLT